MRYCFCTKISSRATRSAWGGQSWQVHGHASTYLGHLTPKSHQDSLELLRRYFILWRDGVFGRQRHVGPHKVGIQYPFGEEGRKARKLSIFVRFYVVHQNALYDIPSVLQLLSLVPCAVYSGLQHQVPPHSQPGLANDCWPHQAQDSQEGTMFLGVCYDMPLVQRVEVFVEALRVVVVDVIIAL
jgi:hypothetical protein